MQCGSVTTGQVILLFAPVAMASSAYSASSAPRQRRVYCCDMEHSVGNGLPPASGTREESLAVPAASRRDLAPAATATGTDLSTH